MDLVNHSGTPKLLAIAHENVPKMQNDKFLITPLKNVLSVMGLVNHPGIPKLWVIAHKKHLQNAKTMSFFVMPLKLVLSDMDLANHTGTQKLWAIAHDNGPKMQK
jgi:hypothetical protein